jgi:hypothetical protein
MSLSEAILSPPRRSDHRDQTANLFFKDVDGRDNCYEDVLRTSARP